jgi:transposase
MWHRTRTALRHMDKAMLSRDEILAVYAAGPEAVVALVESLLARLSQQQQQIDALAARVHELEACLSQDSHNSSKPPSSDGLGRIPRTRSLRQASGKKPGGQPGHAGHTLKWWAQPDEVTEHSPVTCSGCGACLLPIDAATAQCRQVHELPPLRLRVIEHRVLTKACPQCQQLNQGQFPEHVTESVQYGLRLKALAVYLLHYQLLPFERTRELLSDLFTVAPAVAPSVGTLATAVVQCHERLAPVETALKEAIANSRVAHFDETGVRVAQQLCWLHEAGTPLLTHYACHSKRGTIATAEIGILPAFAGTAVHDAWRAYGTYSCAHGLCNAHLLRELTFIQEQTGQPWTGALKSLLCEIKEAVADAQTQGQEQLGAKSQARFVRRYRALLVQGLKANPAPPASGQRGRTKQSQAKNLLDRLVRHESWVLAFLRDFAVPFDNNLAERDLRMVKVQQKVSGCFRSPAGVAAFCRIRGYISTLRKQSDHVLTALESVFIGTPYLPALHPE